MSTPDPRWTSYLLGELSEAEATALEREFFANPDVFARLVEAETELVDDYVRRRLPPPLSARFERQYLSDPRRRARVEFAEALATKIDEVESAAKVQASRGAERARVEVPEARTWLWRASMAAALLVAIGSTGWWWLQSRRLRGELTHSELARTSGEQRTRDLQDQLSKAQTSASALASELERLKTPPGPPPTQPAPSFVSLLLTVPSARAPEPRDAPTLAIPRGTREVRFELAMPEAEYASYQVAVNPVVGPAVFTRQRLVPRRVGAGARIAVTAPAERLVAGDYMLTLTGERPGAPPETVSQLLFRVIVSSRSP
jgi:hypothetical protein